MKKNKESAILGRLLQKIAPSFGAKVLLEPEWKIAGQITFKSGQRSYFRYNTLDLNPVGSSDIAKDKDYSNFFMKSLGYSVIPKSKTFYSQAWGDAIGTPERNIDAAYTHAQKIGFPVIVKPNSGSQGANVALVSNKQEFYRAVKRIFKSDRIALVQQCVHGRDYRVVVLDKKIVSAYERIPLNVIGNGRSTIAQLLAVKQKSFKTSKRDTLIKLDDPRIVNKLKQQKLTFASIIPKDERIFLLDNANLSSGGDSEDVTDTIHPDFKKLAVKLTADMGLRLCGVDLMVDGDISEKLKDYWIIEINSAPGLDHYVTIGSVQKKIVEDLYREVLQHMER
jgi:D-alanine-D-alanine ligase-like ATP-grasp enzyme